MERMVQSIWGCRSFFTRRNICLIYGLTATLIVMYIVISLGMDLPGIYKTHSSTPSRLPLSSTPASNHAAAEVNTNTTKPLCRFDLFNRYVGENSFFPSAGRWYPGKRWKRQAFHPKMCTFLYDELPPEEYVLGCLQRKSLTKLLLLGDSNGRKYFYALWEDILPKLGFQCKMVRKENNTSHPDPAYFAHGFNEIPERLFITHGRECESKSITIQCRSRKQPKGGFTVSLQVEYIVMAFYTDTEIHTYQHFFNRDSCNFTLHKQCGRSDTTQEMIFTEYLLGNYPDLIIIFGNLHSVFKHTLYKSENAITMLAKILVNHTPNSTSILWATTAGKCEKCKGNRWQGIRYEDGKYSYQEMIHKLNQFVFNALKPLVLAKDINILPFLDLQGVSDGILDQWTLGDGIHFDRYWYKLVVSYILQTLCN